MVERLDGVSDGLVSLKAHWGIFSSEKGLLMKKESQISEEVKGKGYDAIVEAMSRAIEQLSREIADGIAAKSAI